MLGYECIKRVHIHYQQILAAITMNFPIVTAALLGAVLAPALADGNGEKNLNGQQGGNSHRPATGGFSASKDYSQAFRTLWDMETGYIATKVLSKNTCVISNMVRDSWLDEPFPAPAQGLKGPHPHYLPPRENRFIISTERLQTLQPYGERIQELCREIPSYFAYPAPGSNFLDKDVSCLKVKINGLPVHYCF